MNRIAPSSNLIRLPPKAIRFRWQMVKRATGLSHNWLCSCTTVALCNLVRHTTQVAYKERVLITIFTTTTTQYSTSLLISIILGNHISSGIFYFFHAYKKTQFFYMLWVCNMLVLMFLFGLQTVHNSYNRSWCLAMEHLPQACSKFICYT